MAKSKDKQPKSDREKKKGFWSNFFEPVPSEEEVDPALANRQYGEPPEPPLRHLFDDEPRQVFLGLVHHNEWASRRIADTIVDSIADLADTSAPR